MYSLKTVNVHGLRSNQRNAGSQVLLYVFALLVSLASMAPCLGQASKSAKKTEVKSVSTDGEFDSGHIYTRIFTPEEMEYLKNTTTLFLLRKQDMDKKAEFEEAIHRAWTFSDIKVISYDEIATYSDKNYAYFAIEGSNREHLNTYPKHKYDATELFLTLKYSYLDTNRKGKKIERSIHYCRIELSADYQTLQLAAKNDPDSVIQILYHEGSFKNWSPAMLLLYLADVQKNLEQSKRDALMNVFTKEDEILKMLNDTLYIPEYVLIKYDMSTGDESRRHNPDELLLLYSAPYKVVSNDELMAGLFEGRIQYVFDYVKSISTALIRVFNVREGKMHQSCKLLSYNLAQKHFKDLLPLIKDKK